MTTSDPAESAAPRQPKHRSTPAVRENIFPVRALLFDCDGVLVDSYDAAATAWNTWAHRWKPGFDFHRDVEHGRRLADYVTELVGSDHAAQATTELEALEREHAVDVREIPGAAALTATLPAGTWAVVTSGSRAIASARLTAAGITVPDVLVTADDVAIGKPAPDPYLQAAARLGRAPRICAVLEDAPAGITAAHRAGVRTIIGVGAARTAPGVNAGVVDLRHIRFDGTTLHLPEPPTVPDAPTPELTHTPCEPNRAQPMAFVPSESTGERKPNTLPSGSSR